MSASLKLKNFCFCCSTKTGSIIIASLNLFYSVINILATGILLILLIAFGSSFGSQDHAVVIVVYLFLGIGLLTNIALFVLSIALIRGVVTRRPRLVFYYLIYGTIAIFLSLISVAIAIFGVGILVTTVITFVMEVYFEVVIYSEYRNIVEEKEQQENDQAPPYSMQDPNLQYSYETK